MQIIRENGGDMIEQFRQHVSPTPSLKFSYSKQGISDSLIVVGMD